MNTSNFKIEVKRGSLAATNIRIALKETFPATKFSVTSSGYDSINVSWTNAPMDTEVKSLLSVFKSGVSSYCGDYTDNEYSDFHRKFGDTTYLNFSQEISDEVVAAVISKIAVLHPDYECRDRERIEVTLDNYQSGWKLSGDHHFRNLFNDYLTAHFENRLSKNELEREAWELRKLIKNMSEPEFIEHSSNMTDSTKFLAEICYYITSSYYSGYYADVFIAQATDKAADDYTMTDILYRIGEAKKALRGEPTDEELRAIESQQQQEKINADIEALQAVKYELIEHEEGDRKLIKISMPSLNKNSSMKENDAEIARKSNVNTYEIIQTIIVNTADWELVTNNFLHNFSGWNPNCGHSRIDDKHLEGITENSEAYYAAWREYGITNCIEVINAETKERFFVDTSGYNYARYVGREFVEPFSSTLSAETHKRIMQEFIATEATTLMIEDMKKGQDKFDTEQEWYQSAFNRIVKDLPPVPTRHYVESVTNDILKKILS